MHLLLLKNKFILRSRVSRNKDFIKDVPSQFCSLKEVSQQKHKQFISTSHVTSEDKLISNWQRLRGKYCIF